VTNAVGNAIGCEPEEHGCFYAHQMREELKAKGWKHVSDGGKDFCTKCKPRRKPRRRSRTTITLVNSERKTERG